MQQTMEDLQELWKRIVAGAGLSHSPWLASCTPAGMEGSELVVYSPDPFSQKNIVENFLGPLNQSASEDGAVSGVRVLVAPQERKPEPARPRTTKSSGSAARNTLNPKYTFDTFVVGKSNRLAQAASQAVAKKPGEAYNPLFIWGGSGLGKTHLMHAICHYALEHSSGLRVLYLSAEKFVNEFVQSMADTHMPKKFKERYRNVDILLMDDIQFFGVGNKAGSREEFFHTFNDLRDGNKQIVICSDRQPSELANIEERLISRFVGGLVVDIQPPDFETRIAILKKKATLRQYDLPDEIIHFLAEHIPSNVRELEGALERVIASSELMQEEITIDRVSLWLKDILRMDVKKPASIEDIKNAVAELCGVSLEDLASAKRTADLAQARQIAMFLCRRMTEATLQQIAGAFRKKDHTTVLHAEKKIEGLLTTDKATREIVDNIKNKL